MLPFTSVKLSQIPSACDTYRKGRPLENFHLPSTIFLKHNLCLFLAIVHANPPFWYISLSLSLNVASFVSFRAQFRYSILCEGFANYIHWAVLLCAAAVPSVSPWPVSAMVGITLGCNYLFTRLSKQLTCKIFRGGAPMFPCRPTRSNPPTLAGVHSKRFLPCYAEQATQARTGTTPKWLLA